MLEITFIDLHVFVEGNSDVFLFSPRTCRRN